MRLTACLLLLTIIAPLSSGPLFETDLEGGVSFLSENSRAGADTLALIENMRLSEWPSDSGAGTIDYDVPERRETLTYLRRQGNLLTGVSGLSRAHPRGADVRFGSLAPFKFMDGDFKIQAASPLSGAYSAVNGLNGPGFGHGAFLVEPNKKFYCRFYAKFLKPELLSDTRKDKSACGYYFFRLDDATEQPRKKVLSLWMTDLFTGFPRLQAHYWPIKGQIDNLTDCRIEWGRVYCIEVSGKVGETHGCGFEIFVDGKKILSDFNHNISHISGVNYVDFAHHCITGTEIVGPVIYDDIVVSEHYIGTLPPPPHSVPVSPKGVIQLADLGSGAGNLTFFQVLLNNENTWMLPMHNSGQMPFYNVTRYVLPPGLRPDSTYYMRVRVKNNMENWGPYGAAQKVTGVETAPAPAVIGSVEISESPGGASPSVFTTDRWYYMDITFSDSAAFAAADVIYIWIHSTGNTLGSPAKKGAYAVRKTTSPFRWTLRTGKSTAGTAVRAKIPSFVPENCGSLSTTGATRSRPGLKKARRPLNSNGPRRPKPTSGRSTSRQSTRSETRQSFSKKRSRSKGLFRTQRQKAGSPLLLPVFWCACLSPRFYIEKGRPPRARRFRAGKRR